MTLAAVTADTWGISGPTFLLAYVVIAVAVAVAGTRARRALADPTTSGPGRRPRRRARTTWRTSTAAADLAVYSALSAMHLRGTITHGPRQRPRGGRPDPGTDELERAIHVTAASPGRSAGGWPFHRPVQTALAGIEAAAGRPKACCSPTSSAAGSGASGAWMLAVAGLGLVRLLAGHRRGQAGRLPRRGARRWSRWSAPSSWRGHRGAPASATARSPTCAPSTTACRPDVTAGLGGLRTGRGRAGHRDLRDGRAVGVRPGVRRRDRGPAGGGGRVRRRRQHRRHSGSGGRSGSSCGGGGGGGGCGGGGGGGCGG